MKKDEGNNPENQQFMMKFVEFYRKNKDQRMLEEVQSYMMCPQKDDPRPPEEQLCFENYHQQDIMNA